LWWKVGGGWGNRTEEGPRCGHLGNDDLLSAIDDEVPALVVLAFTVCGWVHFHDTFSAEMAEV